MSDEEFVSILVPKDRVMDIYAYLAQGVANRPEATPPSGELVTDRDIVSRAYWESPPTMQRFLELLAKHPDKWQDIDDVRDKLGMDVHQLPGVLGAFQKRWRGRYGQAGRWPFDADEAEDGWRYRMPRVNAEFIASLDWTTERFRDAMLEAGGDDAVAVLDDGLAWAERWDGEYVFGGGASGPLYLMVPDRAGESVNVLALSTAGDVGVRYIGIKDHPPFDEEDERRDLTNRLNEIRGISIPDGRWNRKAFNVKLQFLVSPEVRAEFFGVLDDVARRFAEQSS